MLSSAVNFVRIYLKKMCHIIDQIKMMDDSWTKLKPKSYFDFSFSANKNKIKQETFRHFKFCKHMEKSW
jgi:hypothetical protein